MRVFRFEHEGEGIFVSGVACRLQELARDNDDDADPYAHPAPSQDHKLDPQWYSLPNKAIYYFACTSEQIKRTFRSALLWRRMAEHNIYLVEYEVDDAHVLIGDAQVVFAKGEASRIAAYVPDFNANLQR